MEKQVILESIDAMFPKSAIPKQPTPPKVYLLINETYVDNERVEWTEPIDLTDEALQSLADAQQRVVILADNGVETKYKPARPTKHLVFAQSEEYIRTLLNEVETASASFGRRCEDYADSHGVLVMVYHPEGYHTRYEPMDVETRALIRNPGEVVSGCTRCGSRTCAGVSSAGKYCKG